MNKFKYIATISEKELNDNIVIPCINEKGYHSLLIKNCIEKTITNMFSTDNLQGQLNTVLYYGDNKYYFHIITSKKNDEYSITQFNIIFDYVFKKIEKAISDKEFLELINSLEDYFKISPDENLRNLQTGVFGELFTIKYLYELGYTQIIEKYHNNFYSKHDVEISDKVRIEIKSTASEKRIHHFRHNQICRNDVDVYVSSVMLEEAKIGKSLNELFDEVINLYIDPDAIFGLEKLRKKCGLCDDKKGLIFSYEKCIQDFKIYKANSLPMITSDIPNGISNVEYEVDCSLTDNENIEDFIKYLIAL